MNSVTGAGVGTVTDLAQAELGLGLHQDIGDIAQTATARPAHRRLIIKIDLTQSRVNLTTGSDDRTRSSVQRVNGPRSGTIDRIPDLTIATLQCRRAHDFCGQNIGNDHIAGITQSHVVVANFVGGNRPGGESYTRL